MKKYPFLTFFIISFILAAPFVWVNMYSSGTLVTDLADLTASYLYGAEAEEELPSEESEVSDETQESEDSEPLKQHETVTLPKFVPIDTWYWDDALFIGDSRIRGLAEYKDLGDAHVFAENGMTIFTLFEKKNAMDTPQLYLKELLEQNIYGKIYIMLGINELYRDMDDLKAEFTFVLNQIRQHQPNALIFVCANMHVTEKYSNENKDRNNDRVNELNDFLFKYSQQNGFYYIDINEVYDDENGYLIAEYSYDGIHVRAAHYDKWIDWLKTKGVLLRGRPIDMYIRE